MAAGALSSLLQVHCRAPRLLLLRLLLTHQSSQPLSTPRLHPLALPKRIFSRIRAERDLSHLSKPKVLSLCAGTRQLECWLNSNNKSSLSFFPPSPYMIYPFHLSLHFTVCCLPLSAPPPTPPTFSPSISSPSFFDLYRVDEFHGERDDRWKV